MARMAGRRSRSKKSTAEDKSPTQRETLRDVLLSASACGSWLTLRELSRTTRFGEASISAQIRHLRKPECGGFVIEKRVRVPGTRSHRSADPRWEYRMSGSSALEAVMSWRTAEILRDAIEAARRLDTQTSGSMAPERSMAPR